MPSLKRKVHHHNPDIMSKSAVSVIQSSVLRNHTQDTIVDEKRTAVDGGISRDSIRKLNKSSAHTRSSDLTNMVAIVVEEASDQRSIGRELFRVSWWFQNHNRPVVAVHERRAAEDVITTSTTVQVGLDNLCARWEVGSHGYVAMESGWREGGQ
jgi:hypothetical protein